MLDLLRNIKKVEFNPNGIDEVEYFICKQILRRI